MVNLKPFIGKLLPIYTFPTRSIPIGKVSPLQHEARDDPVEDAVLVVQRLARRPHPVPHAQTAEVLSSFGAHAVIQAEGDAASLVASYANVEISQRHVIVYR